MAQRKLFVDRLLRRKMSDYAFALILIGFGLWIAGTVFTYVFRIYVPSREIVFLPFDTPTAELNQQSPQILSGKLRRLQLYAAQTPTGYGFLQVPVLAAVPEQAQAHTGQNLKRLENIQLKIKDVDVPALIRGIQTLFAPPQYEVRGRIAEFSDSIDATCELIYRDEVKATWHASVRKSASENVLSKQVVDKLLDDILFQMIYDFLTKAELKSWKISMTDLGYTPSNWQTLKAYTRGVRALTAYQQNLRHEDLKEALDFLEQLPVVAPDNPYGIYYYGIALSENRQEAEAVSYFEQLQRLPSATEEMRLEAKFNEAAARLKLYRMRDGGAAAKTLEDLVNSLGKAIARTAGQGAAPNGKARHAYYKKLLAVTYAQLAYTHGTILSFLRDAGETREAVIRARYRTVEENIKLAEGIYDTLTGQWRSERERQDVLFRIRNAKGYSAFRFAQHQKNEAEFNRLCRSAIHDLEEADRARPNHYEVLQNLAMIYQDARFDPVGDYLEKAEALYERTKKFVPNDYYQYEQLALIHWRRLQNVTTAETARQIIEKGTRNGLRTLELRPRSGEALWLLARFSVRSWRDAIQEGTAANKAAADTLGYYKQAVAVWPENASIRSEYVEFLVRLAKTQPKDAEVAVKNGVLLVEIAKGIGSDKVEKRRVLEEAIALLTTAISLTSGDKQKAQLHDEALKAKGDAERLIQGL